jgi:hypothetical protein
LGKPPEAAAQIYTLDHPRSLRTARERIAQERDEKVVALGVGNASDFPDYKYRVGQVHGLNEALVILDAAAKEED